MEYIVNEMIDDERYNNNSIVFKVDKDGLLMLFCGYRPFLTLECLLEIEKRLPMAIEFAKSRDIIDLNDKYQYYEIKRMEALVHAHNKEFNHKLSRKNTNVYLMRDEHTGHYKIGYSKNVSKREKTLLSQKSSIVLIFHCEATVAHEALLHKKFESKRVRGEWFDLSEQDVEYVKSKKWLNLIKNAQQ